MEDIWGSSPSSIWAVGWNGEVIHFNGQTWAEVASPNNFQKDLLAIWGSSDDNLWVTDGFCYPPFKTCTDRGTIYHFDGVSWAQVFQSDGGKYMWDLWGRSSRDVWSVGSAGTIAHYDGQTWSSISQGSQQRLTGIWGSSPSDIWAVGLRYSTYDWVMLHFDGNAWEKVPVGPVESQWGEVSIHGSAADNVWAVGRRNVLHYDGKAWTDGRPAMGAEFRSVWTSGPDNVWLLATSKVLHYDGAQWKTYQLDAERTLNAIWGFSSTDIWVGGDYSSIYHFDGQSWTLTYYKEPDIPGLNDGLVSDLWGASSTDIWALSDMQLLHFDGTSWAPVEQAKGNHLWGSGPDNIWVQTAGHAYHYDGKSWQGSDPRCANTLNGIFGFGPEDVWVVGEYGTILHYRD